MTMTDQQVVEQSWLQVGVSDGTKQYPAGTVHIQIQGDRWETFADWADAAEFTREHDRKTAKIEAAIEWNSEPFQCDESELIDVMLKEKLADLKLGMRDGQHQEQERQIDVEISSLKCGILTAAELEELIDAHDPDFIVATVIDQCRDCRILARLIAARDEMRRGRK